MLLLSKTLLLLLIFPLCSFAANEADTKKTHLEDIYIWKMSDELKLSAREEKEFTEINRSLNKQKSDLNKKIQDAITRLQPGDGEAALKNYKKLLAQYNEISLTEFDSIKKLLGTKKFISYLKIKNELNTKLKNILIGERANDKKELSKLPPPKVVFEK